MTEKRPTITESQMVELYDAAIEEMTAFGHALEKIGIEVIPDPAPTNTDRLEQLIRESGYSITYAGHHADARALAETLAFDGVTASKED